MERTSIEFNYYLPAHPNALYCSIESNQSVPKRVRHLNWIELLRTFANNGSDFGTIKDPPAHGGAGGGGHKWATRARAGDEGREH